jgi:hypothetical protein
MSLLSLNCRGSGQPRTVQEILCLSLIQTHRLSLVFLCETRQHKDRVRNLRFRFGVSGCFQVDGDGKGGGIAIFWTEDINVSYIAK